ncbi:hypothetical protein [Actinoplanes missouriensis]|uniref:hypothetical protein n=1 Tax=Actinoplanes missouriensis TaxID=1866 RepID=UPI0012FBF40E|nr:hypothetical protein [Actinoplanes missouriensis]
MSEPGFSHFANTRPRHRRWRIIGVAGSADNPGVQTVEIFQGAARTRSHPTPVWRSTNARAGMKAHEPFPCDLIAAGVNLAA